jgi:hypothetical protein
MDSSQASFFLAFLLLVVLILVGAGLVIALAKWWYGARRTDMDGYEVVGQSGGMRRAIIRFAELAAVLVVLSMTLCGAILFTVYGYIFASALNISQGVSPKDPQVTLAISAVIGGVAGFLLAALFTAPIFVLSAIEKNTRRTAAFLERLALPRT